MNFTKIFKSCAANCFTQHKNGRGNFLTRSHTNPEVITMAKKGMKRPQETHTKPRNGQPPVPEMQGSAKQTKTKAKPITEP